MLVGQSVTLPVRVRADPAEEVRGSKRRALRQCLVAVRSRAGGKATSVAARARFADSVRTRPGLVGAFLIDAVGTGMFIPFSPLFFLATTSLPLTRIGLALSLAALPLRN